MKCRLSFEEVGTFETIPPCEKRVTAQWTQYHHRNLTVSNVASGYIQTPGWIHPTELEAKPAPYLVLTPVALSIPPSHQAMVTVMHVDFDVTFGIYRQGVELKVSTLTFRKIA